MSKAKERACQYTGYCKNQSYSDFLKGYQQAEKDLELTWKDMAEIVKIANLLEIEWLQTTPWDGIRDCDFTQKY